MKNAFLILAHHHPEELARLVQALDDPRFDIFVHVDGRRELRPFVQQACSLRHSTLRFLSRRKAVFWGDISKVEADPQIRTYFRFPHAPDQLFIPTIIYNSPEFREKATTDPCKQCTFNDRPAIHYLRYNPQPAR